MSLTPFVVTITEPRKKVDKTDIKSLKQCEC